MRSPFLREKDRQKTTGLIGGKCKRSNALSLADANGRGLTRGTENLELNTYSVGRRAALTTYRQQQSLGDLSGVGTPGPISNPAVKRASADGTWRATSRESRSSPRDFCFALIAPKGSQDPSGLCMPGKGLAATTRRRRPVSLG